MINFRIKMYKLNFMIYFTWEIISKWGEGRVGPMFRCRSWKMQTTIIIDKLYLKRQNKSTCAKETLSHLTKETVSQDYWDVYLSSVSSVVVRSLPVDMSSLVLATGSCPGDCKKCCCIALCVYWPSLQSRKGCGRGGARERWGFGQWPVNLIYRLWLLSP